MKFFILFFLLALVTQWLLPWWTILPLAFTCAFFFRHHPGRVFFLVFSAVLILWIPVGIFLSFRNNHLLSHKVALLIGLPDFPTNWLLLLFLAPLPVALAAGLSAMSGRLLRSLLF